MFHYRHRVKYVLTTTTEFFTGYITELRYPYSIDAVAAPYDQMGQDGED